MTILMLEIQNFRGIKSLKWAVGGKLVCLVGPGDSTKSTILDAIEVALSPRWNVPFTDYDFHKADIAQPLHVTVTIAGVPDELKTLEKYGLHLRGWSRDNVLHDEPVDGDAAALSIRVTVDKDLEPKWTLFTDRALPERFIGVRDRELLACARIGTFVDRHFTWGKGSALMRLTAQVDQVSDAMADAGRRARQVIKDVAAERLPNLQAAAGAARRAGQELGVRAREDYRPQLDVEASAVGVAGLSLHEGDVPVRMAGLGSRRLLAVAMQMQAAGGRGIVVLDEVELGLEPHRLRRVIQSFRASVAGDSKRQVFLTSHSPVAVHELAASEIRIVFNDNGDVRVLDVPPELQRYQYTGKEALLARRIVVCEGKSELGLCRGFGAIWADEGRSFGLDGVALVCGEGSSSADVALGLAKLKYATAWLADSDRAVQPTPDQLRAAGVEVIQWSGGMSLEQRLATDLPWDGLTDALLAATTVTRIEELTGQVATEAGTNAAALGNDPRAWLNRGVETDALRRAIGMVANRLAWFKRVELAEPLAKIIDDRCAAIADSDLVRKIETLKAWTRS